MDGRLKLGFNSGYSAFGGLVNAARERLDPRTKVGANGGNFGSPGFLGLIARKELSGADREGLLCEDGVSAFTASAGLRLGLRARSKRRALYARPRCRPSPPVGCQLARADGVG